MNSSKLQSELNETLRKIGRNVLNFQRMERMLKFLISQSNMEGTVRTLKPNHDKAVEAVDRQTMGNLVKDLFTSVYQENGKPDEEVTEIKEARFSMSFKVEADDASIAAQKAALERVVKERNLLIHQQLSQFDQTSLHSCRRLGILLDEQRERIKPEFEMLRSLVFALRDGRKEAFETLFGAIEP